MLDETQPSLRPAAASRAGEADPLIRLDRRIALLRSRAEHLERRLAGLEEGIRRHSETVIVDMRVGDLLVSSDDPGVVEALGAAAEPEPPPSLPADTA